MQRTRSHTTSTISDGQATYVLERLRAERRVSDADIRQYLVEMTREISDLEARLARLREVAGASQTRPQVPSGDDATRPSGRKTGRSVASRTRAQRRPPRPGGADRTAEGGASVIRRPKRKFTVTPKVLASRELQGRYLPLLNKFSGRRRADFANIAKERGREAAISAMEAALR